MQVVSTGAPFREAIEHADLPLQDDKMHVMQMQLFEFDFCSCLVSADLSSDSVSEGATDCVSSTGNW